MVAVIGYGIKIARFSTQAFIVGDHQSLSCQERGTAINQN